MDYEGLAKELLMSTGSVIRRMNHTKGLNASRGRSFVLSYLADKGEAYSSEICSNMDVTTARMASILNELEEKGLVTRRIGEEDRRKIIVSITEAGRKKAAEEWQWLMQKLQKLLEQLGPEDALSFVRIMDRIVGMISGNTNC